MFKVNALIQRGGIAKFTAAAAITVLLATVPSVASASTAEFDAAMKPVLANYLVIQSALAADGTKGVKAAVTAIAKDADKLGAAKVSGEHAAHYAKLPKKIKDAAVALSKLSDISAVRESFKELSKPMAMWGSMSKPTGFDVVYCSMAKGSWVQKDGAVRNPYYGQSMLTCGEVVGGAGHHSH